MLIAFLVIACIFMLFVYVRQDKMIFFPRHISLTVGITSARVGAPATISSVIWWRAIASREIGTVGLTSE